MKLVLCLVVVLCGTAVATADDSSTNKEISSSILKGKFFLGQLSTLSHTIVSFTTSTQFYSCLIDYATTMGGDPTICPGKKRRKRRVLQHLDSAIKKIESR